MSKTPLLGLPERTWGLVAYDTETSGLHPDDGARVAVISVAWYELLEDGSRGPLQDRAYPFDQERWEDKGELPAGAGKARPGRKAGPGQEALFGYDEVFDDPNLDRDAWDELLGWLRQRRLVMHNGKFDITVTRAGVRELATGSGWGGTRWHGSGVDLTDNLVWDTMLVQQRLDPTNSLALKETGERLWGMSAKAEQELLKGYLDGRKRYDLVPWDVMQPYATADARMTLMLWLNQRSRLSEYELGTIGRKELALRHRTLRTLARTEHRGVPYDAQASRVAAREIQSRMRQLERVLADAWEEPPTVAAATRYFYQRMGQPKLVTTKYAGGGTSYEVETTPVDATEARFWGRKGVPWAVEWGEYRKMQTAASMWYEGYADLTGPDGRLRTEYKQAFVKSGRMSVGRWQAQAIPKMDKGSGIEGVPHPREFFFRGPGAKEGWSSYNLDLSQAELRIAAHLSGCHRMVQMLAEGADLHSVTTEGVFKTTADVVGKDEWKRLRDIAKRLTFGSIFQIGASTFQGTLRKQADLEWPLNECERAVQGWRETYPEFGRMYYAKMREAERYGAVPLVTGRMSYFGPRDYASSAWNRTVQASLAEFVTAWLCDVDEQTREWGDQGGGLVLTVHDSAVLYLPTEIGDVLVPQLAERGGSMASAWFGCPMRVDHGPWFE